MSQVSSYRFTSYILEHIEHKLEPLHLLYVKCLPIGHRYILKAYLKYLKVVEAELITRFLTIFVNSYPQLGYITVTPMTTACIRAVFNSLGVLVRASS